MWRATSFRPPITSMRRREWNLAWVRARIARGSNRTERKETEAQGWPAHARISAPCPTALGIPSNDPQHPVFPWNGPDGPPTNISGGTFISQNVNNIQQRGRDGFPLPRCHPETRTKLLDILCKWSRGVQPPRRWTSDSSEEHEIMMAQAALSFGCTAPAGSGNFFFKRGHPSRGNANKLFPTIASQLARLPQCRQSISQIVENDPSIVDRSFVNQLHELIVVPCRQSRLPHPVVIVIDGLDECAGNDVQQELLWLIGNAVSRERLPILFLIASRPEAHISETLADPTTRHNTSAVGHRAVLRGPWRTVIPNCHLRLSISFTFKSSPVFPYGFIIPSSQILVAIHAQLALTVSDLEPLLELDEGDVELTLRRLHSVISAEKQAQFSGASGGAPFEYIICAEPSPDLLPGVRSLNPDFIFAFKNPSGTVIDLLRWLEKFNAVDEALVRLWEDYSFMSLCDEAWDPTPQEDNQEWNTPCDDTLLQLSPQLLKILYASKALPDICEQRCLARIHFLLGLSWDDLRKAICPLREIFGDDLEGLQELRTCTFDEAFSAGLEASVVLSHLAHRAVRIIGEIVNDEVQCRIPESCPASPDLLQGLAEVGNGNRCAEPEDLHNVVQWLKTCNSSPDLMARYEHLLDRCIKVKSWRGIDYSFKYLESRWLEWWERVKST
ncbi:hypothetical protein B0H14DRAFT_2561522 [Mycena olivaceomarginata]|nr:hypothetical protein B0H14DRAFT_2561522 [Mycena olivaceomarginata]